MMDAAAIRQAQALAGIYSAGMLSLARTICAISLHWPAMVAHEFSRQQPVSRPAEPPTTATVKRIKR